MSTAADFAPLEALIVDEDTYIEQGLEVGGRTLDLSQIHPATDVQTVSGTIEGLGVDPTC